MREHDKGSLREVAMLVEQEYLTRQDVVIMTSLSVTTVDRLIRSGQLPALRVGRRVLIPHQDFQEWLQALTQPRQGDRLC